MVVPFLPGFADVAAAAFFGLFYKRQAAAVVARLRRDVVFHARAALDHRPAVRPLPAAGCADHVLDARIGGGVRVATIHFTKQNNS